MTDTTAASKINTPRIKLCGFTREGDVQAATALGVDYVGFVFYAASPRSVSAQRAAQLIACMSATESVSKPCSVAVGLFVNHSVAQVRAICIESGVQILQFHGTESPAFCQAASQSLGLPFWKAIHVAQNVQVQWQDLLKLCQIHSQAQALLFDTASPAWGGTGHTFEWHALDCLAQLAHVPPLVLSGGLSAQNVAQGIALLKPWAVDVSSGIEALGADGKALKGVKDPAKMAAFVAAVRSTHEA